MPDVIKVLPDSLANQIAAGEVIQRPASVVKELLENAVDAGADTITVLIKDAGKTLIQVSDTGCGMSETDARLAFERHATSKINSTDDLFSICTKGFRGEALASIAAIANVELKSKREEDQLGTKVVYNGYELLEHEPVNCPKGTTIAVKSLFFNVPARRKFLKKNSTEFSHIITEFQRVALAHPEIEFTLYHNELPVHVLKTSNLKQRIISVFGKTMNQNLTPVNIETSILKITGFIGKPELSKKKSGSQYFFVNRRFMKNAYFHKAIMLAYKNILPPDTIPTYFLYFEIDPKQIDVNIHPTKTEINFAEANAVFQLIQAGVKETLSKFGVVPSIDFDKEGAIDIPKINKSKPIEEFKIQHNENYNPFDEEEKQQLNYSNFNQINNNKIPEGWEKLYQETELNNFPENINDEQKSFLFSNSQDNNDEHVNNTRILQLKKKYIITPVKSGLMMIHQRRAHHRILYEKYNIFVEDNMNSSQSMLYPLHKELSTEDYILVSDMIEEFLSIGFRIDLNKQNNITIKAIPSFLEKYDMSDIFDQITQNIKEQTKNPETTIKDCLTLTLVNKELLPSKTELNEIEMQHLIDNLFACSMPNYTATGKPIIQILNYSEIEKRF